MQALGAPSLLRKKLAGRLLATSVAFLLWWALAPQLQAKGIPLSAKHKKWLEEEVVYIISDDEKNTFVNLTSELEREKFIEEFWALRDPTPGTPENEFKDEHYRRIEYVNHYFGFDSGKEGWRTDRGRIYIQLGEPQQKKHTRMYGEVRPAEIWFYYQTDFPALPNVFNVMFFQPDSISGYRLYSPVLDGPDKLVTRTGAENDPIGSYNFLKQVDPELARVSMTLLTDEPVDPDRGASLASDSLLTRIRNIPNDKFTKEMLERRRQLREAVETRLIFEPKQLELLVAPLFDPEGQSYVHFVLEPPQTLAEMVPKDAKKKEINASVNVLVRSAEKGKLFQQEHRNRFEFDPVDFRRKQDLPVSYEDRLPLPPGKYELTFIFRNELTNVLYNGETTVEVPEFPPQDLRVGPLMVYDKAVRRAPSEPISPFQFSEFQLIPVLADRFGAEEKLSVFFPIHDERAREEEDPIGVLKVEYTLGSLGGGHRENLSEEIDRRSFDKHGNVVHAKSFPLKEFGPGSYRLVVKLTDPVTHQAASETLSFKVVPGRVNREHVVLINSQFAADQRAGWIEYRRGVCEAAAGRAENAIALLQNALQRNPKLDAAREPLVALYFAEGRFDQVVALIPPTGLTVAVSPATAQHFIASLERIGDLPRAIELAERALVLYGPQLPLYRELARIYEVSGQRSRALEVEEKIRQLDRSQGEAVGEKP